MIKEVRLPEISENVETGDVIADRVRVIEQNATLGGFDTHGTRRDDLDAGSSRQRPDVDLQIALGVLSGDESGHHAGVHRDRRVHDQCDPHVRWGINGETLQDVDMGVPAADQDQISCMCPVHLCSL